MRMVPFVAVLMAVTLMLNRYNERCSSEIHDVEVGSLETEDTGVGEGPDDWVMVEWEPTVGQEEGGVEDYHDLR